MKKNEVRALIEQIGVCADTGADGDANPGMILADIVSGSRAAPLVPKSAENVRPPDHKVVDLQALEQSEPDFVATFTEDKKGFTSTTHYTNRTRTRCAWLAWAPTNTGVS